MYCVFSRDYIANGGALAGFLARRRLLSGRGFLFWHFEKGRDLQERNVSTQRDGESEVDLIIREGTRCTHSLNLQDVKCHLQADDA
jgi:hypothetical protein